MELYTNLLKVLFNSISSIVMLIILYILLILCVYDV